MTTCGRKSKQKSISSKSAQADSSYITDHGSLPRLVNAPSREARETAEKLSIRNERTIKLTLFSLQKFIRVRVLSFARVTNGNR